MVLTVKKYPQPARIALVPVGNFQCVRTDCLSQVDDFSSFPVSHRLLVADLTCPTAKLIGRAQCNFRTAQISKKKRGNPRRRQNGTHGGKRRTDSRRQKGSSEPNSNLAVASRACLASIAAANFLPASVTTTWP